MTHYFALHYIIQFSKNELQQDISAINRKPAKGRIAPSKLNKTTWLKQSIFLRKEVIQPHLPIRLPCYDFTPIICPTFGGWLP